MKYVKILLLLGVLGVCLVFFYGVNASNYIIKKNIDAHLVDHPELIPNKETIQYTSMGFKNLTADLYWLRTIQYIGGNAISEGYKKYLFTMLDLITQLNPYFEEPYNVGQLLLPDNNKDDTKTNPSEENKDIDQSITLSLKGIDNFCDTQKIEEIFSEDDLGKIETEEKYKNPCKTYTIPYYLAYIYYFYKNDGINSSNYYKVVTAQDDAPTSAKVLAAIMQGK